MDLISKWRAKKETAEATINHPRMKGTLNGQVFGFYMISTSPSRKFPQANDSQIFDTNPTYSPNSAKIAKLRKRQVMSVNPENSNGRPLRFYIRNVLKFIRRMVSFVTVPFFRFAMRLIQPWRRRLVSLRPTTSDRPKVTSATEIITKLHSEPHQSTFQNEIELLKIQNKDGNAGNRTTSEKSTEVDHVAGNTGQLQFFNNSNISEPVATNITNTSTQCAALQKKFEGNTAVSTEINFVTTSTENSIDKITPTDSYLLFSQILYFCCNFPLQNVLISWEKTYVFIQNAVVTDAKGCGEI